MFPSSLFCLDIISTSCKKNDTNLKKLFVFVRLVGTFCNTGTVPALFDLYVWLKFIEHLRQFKNLHILQDLDAFMNV